MRYGSSLTQPITRQFDPKAANDLQILADLGMAIIAGLLVILALLLVIARDSFLPIWIFMTSLNLMVHIVLFRIDLPDNVYLVLKTILKGLRLDFLLLDSETHM